MSVWPTDSKQVMVEAFYQAGDDPFIYGVIGQTSAQAITDMESDMRDYLDDHFNKGDGSYLFEASWDDGEYENWYCLHTPYWELTVVDFRPLDAEE